MLKNLCDKYKKSLDCERDLCKSGSGSVKIPTCRMHNELYFIGDTISNCVTSNCQIPNHQAVNLRVQFLLHQF